MSRTLLLAEARHQEVIRHVRDVLEARGALLDEMTHARTVFEGLGGGAHFRRGGYVGAYQPVGEKGVEVLVEAWATGPRAAFWATVGIQLLSVVAIFAASPPSLVWYLAAVVLWLWLAVAALVYYLTFRGSRALEDELAALLAERFRTAGLRIVGEEEQLERRIRARLEAEAKGRELAARRAAQPPQPRLRRREAPAKGGKRGLFGKPKA